MKYNTKEVIHEGRQLLFVTRGRSKQFTQKEIDDFLDTNLKLLELGKTSPKSVSGWSIPDNKQRKIMFMKDLKMGVDFCVKKYGVSAEEISAEATRISPSYRIR